MKLNGIKYRHVVLCIFVGMMKSIEAMETASMADAAEDLSQEKIVFVRTPAPGVVGRPKVGVGVLVFNESGEILLGKRRNSHGAGEWSPPGGHLEFGEGFADTSSLKLRRTGCALRELAEETGIIASEAVFAGVTNDIFVAE